jgi:hypothetical protein
MDQVNPTAETKLYQLASAFYGEIEDHDDIEAWKEIFNEGSHIFDYLQECKITIMDIGFMDLAEIVPILEQTEVAIEATRIKQAYILGHPLEYPVWKPADAVESTVRDVETHSRRRPLNYTASYVSDDTVRPSHNTNAVMQCHERPLKGADEQYREDDNNNDEPDDQEDLSDKKSLTTKTLSRSKKRYEISKLLDKIPKISELNSRKFVVEFNKFIRTYRIEKELVYETLLVAINDSHFYEFEAMEEELSNREWKEIKNMVQAKLEPSINNAERIQKLYNLSPYKGETMKAYHTRFREAFSLCELDTGESAAILIMMNGLPQYFKNLLTMFHVNEEGNFKSYVSLLELITDCKRKVTDPHTYIYIESNKKGLKLQFLSQNYHSTGESSERREDQKKNLRKNHNK